MARLPIKSIAAKYGLTQYTTKSGKRFWYKDNGSKVLFVAHQDTVQDPGVFQPVRFKHDTWIFSPTHDDRLGMYVALDYLPKAKIKFDILITDDEEDGRSTALWFDAPKKYNWMFMFDRRGDGAVCYQYDDEKIRYKLGKHNFRVDKGTYSCLRDLEHLGCTGVNFGVGYYDNHEEEAFASMATLRRQLRKFIDFYKEYEFVSMKHDVGYERFAEAISYNSWEDKKETFEVEAISPLKDPFKPLTEKEAFEAADAVYEEIRGSEDDYEQDNPYNHSSQYAKEPEIKGKMKYVLQTKSDKKKKQVLSDLSISPEGELSCIKERFVKRLYEPFEMVHPDKAIQNILRNSFGCRFIYDIVKRSAYSFCVGKLIPAWEVDYIVKQITDLGLDMAMNLQGFMTPAQYSAVNANSYRKRGKTIRNVPANKPMKTNERLGNFNKIAKHDAFVLKPASLKSASEEIRAGNMKIGKQSIILYPRNNKREETVKSVEYLRAKGHKVEVHYVCKSCKINFEILEVKDRIPNICPSCKMTLERDVSLLSKDEVGLTDVIVPAVKQEVGADIFHKIKVIKDKNDDSRYEYIGKGQGNKQSVDKYVWVGEPSKVGFVSEPA